MMTEKANGPRIWLSSVMELEDVPVEAVTVTLRRRAAVGDLTSLMRSIEASGLLYPIVIDRATALVVGWRRLEAAHLLRWPTIPACRLADELDTEARCAWELNENTLRRDYDQRELAKWAKGTK